MDAYELWLGRFVEVTQPHDYSERFWVEDDVLWELEAGLIGDEATARDQTLEDAYASWLSSMSDEARSRLWDTNRGMQDGSHNFFLDEVVDRCYGVVRCSRCGDRVNPFVQPDRCPACRGNHFVHE